MSDIKSADAQLLVRVPNVSFTCPHCGVYSQHSKPTPSVSYQVEVLNVGNGVIPVNANHSIMRCGHCNKDTYFLIRQKINEFEILHQHPLPTILTDSSLGKDLADAALEAEKCLAVGAPNACGVMCRRAMHVLCQDKGATGKDLYDQLQDLKDKHIITPDLWEWAEELRVVGKHGAHPEWEDVTQEDAEYAVKFLREIIRYAYVNPSERAARKMKETSVKK